MNDSDGNKDIKKSNRFSALPPLHDYNVKMPNFHILWRM